MLTNLDTLSLSSDSAVGEENAILAFPRSEPRMAQPTRAQRIYAPLRRLVDFALALVLTVLAAPIVLLAALAVRLTSRGPAFYTQIRTGKNGRPFTIFKIRTMIDQCESLTGPRWTIPGDPRITYIGWFLRRAHIDELPQLLNVLFGEMSLIGPRPERPEFVEELAQALPTYRQRLAVLPGITGLAQVQLAPDTDLESVRRKLICDVYAIEHVSLWLDLRILLATGLHMLGMSFERLHRLRIVPRPEAVDQPPSRAQLPLAA
ncbi:MAG: sugar transferase [Planctomycetes bacterium]|jgi:lipopolysaccharide/colanic/teichoic acid biosynthesis glycosyltransferase|nr:sugar transferase [Planctomycetota bacterium]